MQQVNENVLYLEFLASLDKLPRAWRIKKIPWVKWSKNYKLKAKKL